MSRRVLGPGRPVIQPSGRLADQLRQAFDRKAHVLALDLFGHRAIVDPAIAVADDLVPAAHAGLGQFGVLLESAHDAQNADHDRELGKDVEQAPGAAATAVFEHQLDERHASTALGADTDVVEHALGHGVAIGERRLPAALDVEVEVDGDMRAVRPSRVRRELPVSDEVAGDHRIGLRLGHRRLAHTSANCCSYQLGRVRGARQAS